ncbi:Oidioi.mRNA.OKI2018_I69.chr2.g5313.t1.cds [Oikopleura dioica]|uniref:Oidioi.mRNA.OKI2018_I69.chr2.g5313.t1.cds n=1 Tax=Oikopleura dioica TaxID=34765 RepID=A0ABN7T0H5_OIKDI|nr:Oidioi.mRNA.OKI2018_I69.chr2.g5313.t1.cds [Oikopleura dioica]
MAQLSTAQVQAHLSNDSVLFIDVRRPDELEAGKLGAKNFLNITHTNVPSEFAKEAGDFKSAHGIEKPKLEQEIIVYCQKGKRGQMAQNALIELGYKSVSNWEGGYSSL